jgi:hypothetical protein
MLLSKLKKAAVALVILFVLVAGTAAVLSQTTAAQRPRKGEAAQKAEKQKADREAALPLVKGEAKVRTRWEYKAQTRAEIEATEFRRMGGGDLQSGLNELGKQGWELVAIEPPVPRTEWRLSETPAVYVFKRPRK